MWGGGRWNVRPPAGLEEGAEDSRSEAPAGVLGGTGVVRSTAGSLLWLHCDLGTTADAVAAGLSARSSSEHNSGQR